MKIQYNREDTIFSIKRLSEQPLCVGDSCSFENQFKLQKKHLDQVKLNLINLASKKLDMRKERTFCYWLRNSNNSISIDFFNIDEEFLTYAVYEEILELFKSYAYNNPRASMQPLEITHNRSYLHIRNLNKYKIQYLKEEILIIYLREFEEEGTHYNKRGEF